MIERTGADWDALAAEFGRLYGDVVTFRRAVAERDALIADLRARLAATTAPPDQPPNPDPEVAP